MEDCELDMIPEMWKKGSLSKEEAVMKILERVYMNPGRFNLLDMDGDGEQELLVGFVDSEGYWFTEIWDYENSELRRMFHGDFSLHSTNGFLPYVEFYRRKDQQEPYSKQAYEYNLQKPSELLSIN